MNGAAERGKGLLRRENQIEQLQVKDMLKKERMRCMYALELVRVDNK